MGWSAEALAPRLDATEAAVEVITRSTPFDRRKVTPAFAALVAAAYDELWDVTGDPELAKRTRSRPHYAPPMAWDDNPGDPHFIDDPACPVSDWRPPRGGYPRRLADRPADVAEMLGWGLTADEIAGRFGVHPETVDRIRRSLARRAVAS
jgi:DNA-binding NarL/FixJ family response regulator